MVADPAWFGNQCCVKYTSMSSGTTVCNVLLPVALTVCSHSASSDTAPFLVCKVLALTDCCCRLAAAVRPFLYRLEHSCVSSFGAVQVLGIDVAQRLELCFFRLAGSRLKGACTTLYCQCKGALQGLVAPTVADTAILGHSWLFQVL